MQEVRRVRRVWRRMLQSRRLGWQTPLRATLTLTTHLA
jgi:hypothetical protein